MQLQIQVNAEVNITDEEKKVLLQFAEIERQYKPISKLREALVKRSKAIMKAKGIGVDKDKILEVDGQIFNLSVSSRNSFDKEAALASDDGDFMQYLLDRFTSPTPVETLTVSSPMLPAEVTRG